MQITLDRGDAGTFASFEADISEVPQVRQTERLFGDPDYLLRVVVRDLDSFTALRDQQLATRPGVQRLTSTIAMNASSRTVPCRSQLRINGTLADLKVSGRARGVRWR